MIVQCSRHVHVQHYTYMYAKYFLVEGTDYERLSTNVTLSPSNPERCVSVEVVDDSAVELDESLTVSLSLPAGGLSSVQLTPNTTTILITDNDGESSPGPDCLSSALNILFSIVIMMVIMFQMEVVHE